jgi:lipoprotein-releasing system ATP-binding protein
MNSLIRMQNVSKSYVKAGQTIEIIDQLSFEVPTGKAIAIMGESGVGKSTLLQMMGGIMQPTQGEIWFKGTSLYTQPSAKREKIRNQDIGFIFQFHYLLPEFTALENVCMPLRIGGVLDKNTKQQAVDLLERVGLGHRLSHKPTELSGGEQQRVAIARALIMKPSMVLADEPTGNLDKKTSEIVSDLCFSMAEALDISMILVTHSASLASKADEVYRLKRGELIREGSF